MLGLLPAHRSVYQRCEQIGPTTSWTRVGHAKNVVAITNLNGRLYCTTTDGTLWMRPPLLHEVDWTPIGALPTAATAIAGHAGKLLITTVTDELWWRDAVR